VRIMQLMARPIEFSPDETRARIADVFSAHGYNGTSLSMLMAASGLGKQSLYNAFGDKKQMYLDAVDCSVASFGRVIPEMNRAQSGMAAIEVFFDHVIDCCVSDSPSVSNCIVSNGLLNNAEENELQAHHAGRWAASHKTLKDAIKRGLDDGSIGNHITPISGADLLMSLASGLRVNARAFTNALERCDAEPTRATKSAQRAIGAKDTKAMRARLSKSVKLGLSLFKPSASS
jgi:TetR/AcrR family transcriptional regulator, transcriptional repressor for nem operon